MARSSRRGTARPERRPGRRSPGSREAPTLPEGPVAIDTGTAAVERDPDRPDLVTLHVNGVPSSALDLSDPGFLAFEYMQQFAAVVAAMPSGPLRVLHLGAAGSAFARAVEHERPGSRQLGVDVDARLLDLARSWFALPRSPALRLRADDAGHALETLRPGSYDVVVRDVFAGDRTPDHLADDTFAAAAHRVLRPGGLLLANCADRPPLHLARRELATLAGVFGADAAGTGRLGAVAEPGVLKGRRYGNVVLAAVRAPAEGRATGDHTSEGRANGDHTSEGHTSGGAAGTGAGPDAAGPDVLDLRDPAIARALRTLPVPAHLLVADDVARFAGLTG